MIDLSKYDYRRFPKGAELWSNKALWAEKLALVNEEKSLMTKGALVCIDWNCFPAYKGLICKVVDISKSRQSCWLSIPGQIGWHCWQKIYLHLVWIPNNR